MDSSAELDPYEIIPIDVLDSRFLDGKISRELRWSYIQRYLLEFTDFLRRNHCRDVGFEIIEDQVILAFQITNSKPVRIKMVMSLNEIRGVPFITLAEGEYEPLITKVMLELSIYSSHFLDVGANMGYYALALSTNNQNLKVEAFEPLEKMQEILRFNLKLNNLEKSINIHEYGLGNENFVTQIFVPKFTGSSGASLMKLHPEEGEHAVQAVEIKRLDSLMFNLENVDLIKIDVEGAEFSTIQGAINLINTNKPTIMVELLRKWMAPFGSTPQDVVTLLLSIGYEAYAVSDEIITRIDSINEKTSETNFLFCHPEQVKHIEILAGFVNRK